MVLSWSSWSFSNGHLLSPFPRPFPSRPPFIPNVVFMALQLLIYFYFVLLGMEEEVADMSPRQVSRRRWERFVDSLDLILWSSGKVSGSWIAVLLEGRWECNESAETSILQMKRRRSFLETSRSRPSPRLVVFTSDLFSNVLSMISSALREDYKSAWHSKRRGEEGSVWPEAQGQGAQVPPRLLAFPS